jgi:hypothetical protein
MTREHADARLTAAVAAALTVAVLAVAALVRVAYAEPARAMLAFGFGGVAARPQSVVSIFAANARLLAAVIAAAVIVQSAWCGRLAAPRAPLACAVVAALDTLLALQVALNVLIVGAALGAYGTRMVAAILPHGPFELAAFAFALALYLRARRHRLAPRRIATTAAACLGLLAFAAVLETYAAP